MSFLDLDGFKPINDTFGHAVGDLVLQEVARRLRAAVRDSDVIARVGGDEFVVVQECLLDGAAAAEQATRLADLMADAVAVAGTQIRCGVSVGSVIAAPGQDAAALVAAADAAMYVVKRQRDR